jgi:hypothetical protein
VTVIDPSEVLIETPVAVGPITANRFASPFKGWYGGLQNFLANSRDLRAARRFVFSKLPFAVLRSDVRDVVYASWIVPVKNVADLVPAGVSLHEREGRTVLTVLTYRHGHFGPEFLGVLRKLCPSPLQSNWRLYVEGGERPQEAAAARTVLFIKNVFNSALYGIGTRLFSDSLPSHVARKFTHRRRRLIHHIEIGGPGSAPTLMLEAAESESRMLPPDLQDLFGSWADAVGFLCLQDAALATVDEIDALAYAEIDLPIDLAAIQPLEAVEFQPGEFLTRLGATGAPFCFRVPGVRFRVLSERLIQIAA